MLLLQLAATKSASLINAMKYIQNPFKTCEKIFSLMVLLIDRLKSLGDNPKTASDGKTWFPFRRKFIFEIYA